MYYHYLDY